MDVKPTIIDESPPSARKLYRAGVHFRSTSVRGGDLILIVSANVAGASATELHNLADAPI